MVYHLTSSSIVQVVFKGKLANNLYCKEKKLGAMISTTHYIEHVTFMLAREQDVRVPPLEVDRHGRAVQAQPLGAGH